MFQIEYRVPEDKIRDKELNISLWHSVSLQEISKRFLGHVKINLANKDLRDDTPQWYQLKGLCDDTKWFVMMESIFYVLLEEMLLFWHFYTKIHYSTPKDFYVRILSK